jgi:hypothetical protein
VEALEGLVDPDTRLGRPLGTGLPSIALGSDGA